jgi:hypothetical protein
MTKLFGKAWLEHLLGTDTFFGRMKFRRKLKVAIGAAIVAGTLGNALPGLVKEAQAATPDQTGRWMTLLKNYNAWKDHPEHGPRFRKDMVRLMDELFEKLNEELERGKIRDASWSLKMIADMCTRLSLGAEWGSKIEDAQETINTLKNNNILRTSWADSLESAHKLKKAGKKIPGYKLEVSGSNWRFNMIHGSEGDADVEVDGERVNIVEVERAIRKSGLSKAQKNHARAVFLRILMQNHPNVSLIAK